MAKNKLDNWDRPFKDNKDIELGVRCPYSKVSKLVLFLYSLELGTPPLFREANRVTRDQDIREIDTLGPFIQMLSLVTYHAEQNKKPNDKIKTGMIRGGIQHNITGAFLLFRGAQMKEEWLDQYKKNKGTSKTIHLKGNTSSSRLLNVGLGFATKDIPEGLTPTLFVILCKNYKAPQGVIMGSKDYTAYVEEEELLFTEGCPVLVLAIEKNV